VAHDDAHPFVLPGARGFLPGVSFREDGKGREALRAVVSANVERFSSDLSAVVQQFATKAAR
jgi:hypothetical protein